MDKIVSVNIAAWLACLAFMVVLANGVLKLVDRARGKSNTATISPQPLAVEIKKALHDQFAEKTDLSVFIKQKEHCTGRHGQLFKAIESAEKSARAELLAEIAKIQVERQQSLNKLDVRHQRLMYALGRIAQKLNVDIDPVD